MRIEIRRLCLYLQWALDKLVSDSSKWGVFAIKYRTIDCGATLANPAPAIPLVADPHTGQKPADLDCATQGGSSNARTTGLATEATSAQRATVSKGFSKGHSRKFWNRRKVKRLRQALACTLWLGC